MSGVVSRDMGSIKIFIETPTNTTYYKYLILTKKRERRKEIGCEYDVP